jgi:hypothetical protein
MSEHERMAMRLAPLPTRPSASNRGGRLHRRCACGSSASSGGDCADCKKGTDAGTLQRRTAGHSAPSAVPTIVHDVLRSPGRSLDRESRDFFEPRFKHDFGRVRVHTDEKAAESARAVNALAYTVGKHVVFAAGRYVPGLPTSQRLLAHELAHTLQQPDPASSAEDLQISEPQDHWEREADRVSYACLAGYPVSVDARVGISLSRQQAHPETPQEKKKREEEEFRRQIQSLTQGPHIVPSSETPEELAKKKKQQEVFQHAGSSEEGRTPPGTLKTWGWGGPETDNIYQKCSLEPMDRSTFRAFLKTLPFKPQRDKLKDMDDVLGVTAYAAEEAVPPAIAAVPIQDGKKTVYKLKPTHAEMPPIKSAYTKVDDESKEFVEGSLTFINQKCNAYWKTEHNTPPVKYDIVWKLPDDGADKVKKAEAEHCTDIRLAFDLTLGRFASSLNNLAAAERTYSSEKQAVDEAVKWVGVQPSQMIFEFAKMAGATRDRDSQGWHTAKCVTPDHCQTPDPDKNKCRGYIRVLDAASLPEVGPHPSSEVIK